MADVQYNVRPSEDQLANPPANLRYLDPCTLRDRIRSAHGLPEPAP
jgi:hypothetical protein